MGDTRPVRKKAVLSIPCRECRVIRRSFLSTAVCLPWRATAALPRNIVVSEAASILRKDLSAIGPKATKSSS